MQKFSNDILPLVDAVRAAEDTLEKVERLSNEGGPFRIRLVVDHPDEALCEAVTKLAARPMPRTNMMPTLIKAAQADLAAAQGALMDFTLSRRLDQEVATQLAAE